MRYTTGMIERTKKILIVDDTSLLSALTYTILSRSMLGSPKIDLASSPTAALNMLQQEAYDVLLLNHQAESIDSMDVLRQLRIADHQTEAVVVAGWLTPTLVEHGRTLGVRRFFRLPAEIDAFTRHLTFSSS